MPVPHAILSMQQAAHLCGQFPLQLPNPKASLESRAQLARNFHVYLEVGMQSKHDAVMQAYCKQINVEPRRPDGTQVDHPKGTTAQTILAPAGFYGVKARVAAEVARNHMLKVWQQQSPLSQQPAFKPETRIDAGVQKQLQSDLYRYEVSYWYGGPDVYVLFHCYPGS